MFGPDLAHRERLGVFHLGQAAGPIPLGLQRPQRRGRLQQRGEQALEAVAGADRPGGDAVDARVEVIQPDEGAAEKLAAHQDEQIDRFSKLADSMRGQTEKRARLAKVLDRKVEKLQDNRVEVTKKERKVTFKLPIPPRSGDVPMTVEHVAVSYGSLKVLRDVNFITRRGDRIVIVGRNGAGKSSMLRCLAGTQKAQQGIVKFGANVSVGYFAQENEQLDFDKTVLGNLENATVVTEVQRRSLLGAFGLKGSAAHQMPGTLSGGERAKLALAILASSDANLLLLDEPTNNLDPASVVALGEMMHKWKGTIVAVSHERGFVETLEPTHAVLLPEEYFDLWNDDYMDLIEQR